MKFDKLFTIFRKPETPSPETERAEEKIEQFFDIENKPGPEDLFLFHKGTDSTDPREVFKVGDVLTRNNFTAFLIYSFAVSRGAPLAQVAFIKWYGQKYNTDVSAIFEEFTNKSAFHALSTNEQDMIISAYNAVGKHEEATQNSEPEDKEPFIVIPPEILRISRMVTSDATDTALQKFFYECSGGRKLEEIETMEDLRPTLSNIIKRVKATGIY